MKRAGFVTGAILAAIGVWLFNQWRSVSDDDLLTLVMQDHCLPYVQTGAQPFTDVGRSPGVYDDVALRDGIENGGARLIFDNRFTAQWGVVTGGGRSSRLCDVKPTYGENTIAAFEVSTTGFIERYSEVLGLTPERDTVDSGPTTLSWRTEGVTGAQGLRAAMIVSPGLVSGVTVMDDLAD